jgi:hypothetical protein
MGGVLRRSRLPTSYGRVTRRYAGLIPLLVVVEPHGAISVVGTSQYTPYR